MPKPFARVCLVGAVAEAVVTPARVWVRVWAIRNLDAASEAIQGVIRVAPRSHYRVGDVREIAVRSILTQNPKAKPV